MSSLTPRRSDNRVAVPVEGPPSLIPEDVWRSYQQEVQGREEELALVPRVTSRLPASPTTDPVESAAVYAHADAAGAMSALGAVSLFSGLSPVTLACLVREARGGAIPPGDCVFREGQPADSFFVLVDGSVEVSRQREDREVPFRQLKSGEALGLFGLFCGRKRNASARALTATSVLEVPSAALGEALRRDEVLCHRVLKCFRERMVESFIGSTRVFSEMDAGARERVLGRFQEKTLKPGHPLLQPGEVTNLLAIVLNGKLVLEHPAKPGQPPQTTDVRPGRFLAVVGALTGIPVRLTVRALEPTTLALLSHKDFIELLREHPALRTIVARLPSVGQPVDRDVFLGHTGAPGL